MTEDTLRMIYHSYVHSIITYGIIFWGNSPHSTHIFKIQKQIIRIKTKSRGRDSCRQLFNRLCYFMSIFFTSNAPIMSAVLNVVTIWNVEVVWDKFNINTMYIYL